MSVTRVPVRGVFEENAYFHIDDETGHGFLVDPGAEAERLLELIEERGWHIEGILLTHGHFDHTGGVEKIAHELGIGFYAHENAREILSDPWLNLSAQCECPQVLEGATFVRDGEVVPLEANPKVSLRVLHTPGHTPDSVVFHDARAKVAYVGDAVFRGSLGTDRYPGGNLSELRQSARTILSLPDDTILLPGHGPATDVATEKSRLGWVGV